jgi:hypothetical protein
MKVRRVVVIAAAFAVALVPTAASAGTLATQYTQSYAGYYVTHTFSTGSIVAPVTLPTFSSLSQTTTGITTEIRIYSSIGEIDLQFGADPQTATTYTPTIEAPGFGGPITCNGIITPGNDTEQIVLQSPAITGGLNQINWWPNINGPSCGIDFNSTFTYSKVAFVGSFNPKTFHAPPHPVTLASFDQIQLSENTASGTLLSSYNHGRLIATGTGTGTKTGIVRAKPSALINGSSFTVTIP